MTGYAKGLAADFANAIDKLGAAVATIALTLTMTAQSDAHAHAEGDIDRQLDDIKASNVAVVLFVGQLEDAKFVLGEASRFGLTGDAYAWIGVDGWMSDAFFADGLGDVGWGSALQNVVGTAPYAGEGGTAREEFRQRFLDSPVVLETYVNPSTGESYFPHDRGTFAPLSGSIAAYEAARTVGHALRDVFNSDDPAVTRDDLFAPSLSNPVLFDRMRTQAFEGVSGTTVQFDLATGDRLGEFVVKGISASGPLSWTSVGRIKNSSFTVEEGAEKSWANGVKPTSPPKVFKVTRVSGCATDLAEKNTTKDCMRGGGDVLNIELENVPSNAGRAGVISVHVDGVDCTNAQLASGGAVVSCTLSRGQGEAQDLALSVSYDGERSQPLVGAVSFNRCSSGRVYNAAVGDCRRCDRGRAAAEGAAACDACTVGTFSPSGAAGCALCPALGVSCDGTLQPLDGWWSPANATGDTSPFTHNTTVYECLLPGNQSCVAANVTDATTPATAYACVEGHAGVLCASCSEGWYLRKGRCRPCDAAFNAWDSPLVRAIAITLGVSLCVHLAYKLFVRSRSKAILKVLNRMRTASRAARRRARKWGRKGRRRRRRGVGKTPAALAHEAPPGRAERWRTQYLTIGLKTIHRSVTKARSSLCGLAPSSAETLRIVLNLAKIVAHVSRLKVHRCTIAQPWGLILIPAYIALQFHDRHNFGTSAYCVTWPKAMGPMVDIASIFALNLRNVAARMPCSLSGYNYFSRVQVVIWGPPAVMLFFFLCGVAWTVCCARRVAGWRDHWVSASAWRAAPAILFFVDIIYPTAARTLSQMFICRDLGAAGSWIEADYSP